MIARLYRGLVEEKLAGNPAVALLGPRQCGKTTLAKELGGVYFDMESEGGALRLDAEWPGLMAGDRLVVVDEAQVEPGIFPRLRGAIDEDRGRMGRFLLLGSVSPALMHGVSESLAGRMGLVRMGPFAFSELEGVMGPECLDALWLRGGYPDGGILAEGRYPGWERDYLSLLAARDLPNWGFPSKPQRTMRLLSMLAAMQGQPQNASELGGALGMDHKTVAGYCDFLEEVFLIRRLRPWFRNVGKRLVKTPRVYWRDSGLLHALLGVRDLEHLYGLPVAGYSWEGFVVEQVLAALELAGAVVEPYFFRTSDGVEADLVLDFGGRLWAIEVKLTSNPTRKMVEGLKTAGELIGAERCMLVCRTAEEVAGEGFLVTNLAGILGVLLEELRR
jgi:uncharacterized protein